MAPSRKKLGSLRILVSNDDGIHAPGLKLLTRIAQSLSDDVWVVAPETEQSAASHSLTVRTPLRMRKLGPRKFAVDGTPTDCVLLGVLHLLKDHQPDLVLSGINNGSNLAEDIAHSGTVAAASMGAALGLPSIAFSQTISVGETTRWATAEKFAPDLIRKLMAAEWQRDSLVNVNFPDKPASAVKDIVVTHQGRRRRREIVTESVDPFGRPYYWMGSPRNDQATDEDSDISVVSRGAVSVTPLRLDLTQEKMLSSMRKVLG